MDRVTICAPTASRRHRHTGLAPPQKRNRPGAGQRSRAVNGFVSSSNAIYATATRPGQRKVLAGAEDIAMTANPTHQPIEITVFQKTGGPLTKRISLDRDGKVISDGSACVMLHGRAERVIVSNLTEAARLIAGQRSNQAITLGMLRPDLPDKVEVTTKDKLNGSAQLGIIARTGDYIVYRRDQLALALIDIDTKGMPAAVKATIETR